MARIDGGERRESILDGKIMEFHGEREVVGRGAWQEGRGTLKCAQVSAASHAGVMTGPIEQGASEIHGNTRLLHFLVRLPEPMETVWSAIATPEGLAGWFTAAEVLEPRLGGAVVLRDLGGGRVTAWDVDRVAEYTVEGGGRIRFHLERDGEDACILRFTHEFQGEVDSEQRWWERFELLVENLGREP